MGSCNFTWFENVDHARTPEKATKTLKFFCYSENFALQKVLIFLVIEATCLYTKFDNPQDNCEERKVFEVENTQMIYF